jgi:hypothetical protein
MLSSFADDEPEVGLVVAVGVVGPDPLSERSGGKSGNPTRT